MCFSIIFGALAGGRAYHFVYRWTGWETLDILFDLRVPGLTSFGMIAGGFAGFVIFSYAVKMKSETFMRIADISALGTLLWVFIYRISSYPHGSVPGTETAVPWKVFALSYYQYSGTFIHPTALYLSFAALLIFIFLHWYRRRQRFAGETALLFLLLYSS